MMNVMAKWVVVVIIEVICDLDLISALNRA